MQSVMPREQFISYLLDQQWMRNQAMFPLIPQEECLGIVRTLEEKTDVIGSFLLDDCQLFEHGFPIVQNGHVYMQPNEYQMDREMFVQPYDCTRRCTRCKEIFTVDQQGAQWNQGVTVCSDLSSGEQYNYHITDQQPISKLFDFYWAPKDVGSNFYMSGQLFAIDVEQVYTSKGQAVGRVTLIDCLGRTLVDVIVQPEDPVIDYVTKYSGLTPDHFLEDTVPLHIARTMLFQHINEDSILVGHGLHGDLKALGIVHVNVIDTAILYMGRNNRRPALRNLTKELLGYTIQESSGGHCSQEDAVASLRLVYYAAHNRRMLGERYQ